MTGRLRDAYGEGPGHLLGHVAVFAGAVLVLSRMLDSPSWLKIVIWLVGGALIHDLVFGPGVAVADRLLQRGLPAPRRRGPNALNHVRVVLVVSGALLLVYFPLILGRADRNYLRATGHGPADYLGRWLAVTAGLILVSAIAYVIRRLRRVDDLEHVAEAAADEHPAGA